MINNGLISIVEHKFSLCLEKAEINKTTRSNQKAPNPIKQILIYSGNLILKTH